MKSSVPKIPGMGPPKKGFWGFVASLFPKRPSPLDTPSPADEVKPVRLSPDEEETKQGGSGTNNPPELRVPDEKR